MRHRWLIAYDVSEAKRLRRMHRLLDGYGDGVQYSVFICDLTDVELQLLREQVLQVMHQAEDRVMFVDLGPMSGRAPHAVSFVGREGISLRDKPGAVII
ncbi:MAG: CRISPR-associated endonuclease Cas2 [Gemmatimonadaceae bacterium]|nr:CRISPR-associated endonuclease Cas2 [Gemmatimonadaceae bacterium]